MCGRKRDSIVRPNGGGQAEVFECPLEHGEGIHLLRRRQRVTGNQIPAREVGDRQRIAVPPIGEHELALVVRTPERVRLDRLGPGGPVQARATATAARHQALPIQHRMHGADRRALQLRTPLPQPLANLRRAPRRVLLLEPDNRLLDEEWQLIGVPVGPPTPIRQRRHPAVPVPVADLVAGFSRDPELGAEPRHLFPVEQARDKSETLVLHVTLLPGHAPSSGAECHPCLRNKVLPLSQEGHSEISPLSPHADPSSTNVALFLPFSIWLWAAQADRAGPPPRTRRPATGARSASSSSVTGGRAARRRS